MGRMSDPDFALQFRDIIRTLVRNEIASQIPSAKSASVKSIDRKRYTASVRIQGDSTDTNVRLGAIQPVAIGQIVRIEGSGSNLYIADIIGGAVTSGLNQVITDWNTATEPGDYIAYFGSTANGPAGGAAATYAGHVYQAADTGNIVQILSRISTTGTNEQWIRQYDVDTTTWSPWNRVFSDTGLITDTSIITAASGATVNSVSIQRIGNVVQCYLKFTTPAITVTTSGDITNTDLGTINDARFIPRGPAGLWSSFTGIQVTGGINGSSGLIQLVSVPPGTASPIASGTLISLSGTYMVDPAAGF